MRKFRFRSLAPLLAGAAILATSGCSKDGDTIVNPVVDPGAPASGSLLGITGQGILFNVSAADPATIVHSVPVTGLLAGEAILTMDYRPADGQLYGYTSSGRTMRIDPANGAALQIGDRTATVPGAIHGCDWDPVRDILRVVTESDANVEVSPRNGQGATDTNLAFAASDPNAGSTISVIGIAYTNNTAGAATTLLYGVDSFNHVLVRLPSPNNGQVLTVGALGVPDLGCWGMDIARDGTAFAVIENSDFSNDLYTLNLATGAATLRGRFGTGARVYGFTVVP